MVELVGNIPDDVVLQARLDILYGQTPDITIKAHELPEESEPTVEKSGTLAEPVFDIGIPQAMGAVAAREYAKQAEAARDAAILAGENAKEELNGIVASADAALDQKITETGTALDEKVATATQRASEAASSAAAAAQKATAAEQAMQGAQAAQVQAEQSAQEAAENTAMAKDFASGQPVTYSGTPVSIAYAGANRIASITAYGETPQGGTTEAPVAITGVDSVFVGGRNLLPKATKTQTIYGVTFTPNPNGSVSVSGTCAGDIATYNYADNLIPISPNQVVYLSGASQLVKVVINEKTPSGAFVRNVLVDRGQGISGTLTKQKEENILYATLQVQIGDAPNLTIHPMLNLGESPLPYEPYQGSVTQLPIPRPLRRVGDVKDKCVTRQDYESAEKLVVTYNVGFVELDGTENWQWNSNTAWPYIATFLPNNKTGVAPVCSHYQGTGAVIPAANQVAINELGSLIIKDPSWKSVDDAKAYLAAQKAAGTPVQIAYQLATPETYATDPVDFDNTAGPLTVMTGGEVVVRMTELVGSRSPELAGKMDKATYDADGDGVVDEAEKVSNALTLKNAAGEVVATFDGSEAAILQLTAALVGALGKTETAADSSKLAGLTPVVDNPGPNNRNTWYFPFTGTNNRDGTRKYYAALYADNATTAGRASNLSMGLNGTDLWVYYS